MPSIYKWAGTYPKIFKIPLIALIPVLQVVCRHYYDDNTIKFERKDAAVYQVCAYSLLVLILIVL